MTTPADQIEPLEPSSDLLHEIRDREAVARLEIERCRKQREAMAAWMLLDGSTSRVVSDVTGVHYNRLSVIRTAIGAKQINVDRARLVFKAAQETDDVGEIAKIAGVSPGYVYQLLHDEPVDALQLARINASKIRAAA